MIQASALDTLWPGRPHPVGATWDGMGVNFALFSEAAERVELCLFDRTGRHEVKRHTLRERTDNVWHGYLPQARPGLLYGYRAYGRYRPHEGLRFNANKLLIDPYARQLVGPLRWHDALFGYRTGHHDVDLSFDRRDSAPYMPRCKVLETGFSWGDDRPPQVPWNDTVIYELHVRGFTQRHPDVPPELRGSFAGLASPAAIEHFKRLGVTTLELLPTHAFVNDRRLVERGLFNYWGYNTLGFFAPHQAYLASGEIDEFKTMVRTLHAAGLEVVMDVVYNHTAEGDELGPTLAFRGLDNASYYRLQTDDRRRSQNLTGCGNTLNAQHPRVLQLVVDSLRYWVTEMHVDGFRFDLASVLAREADAFDPGSGFLDVLRQDPVLSRVKLIAEPWDLGPGGYQVGHFPAGWSEWNDKYRDAMRAFWKGDGGVIGDFARRLSGSSDLYNRNGRAPQASINLITAHDGFTLRDLVSYEHKHNEANGEDNRDGHNHNLSFNHGVEGDTDDASVLALRARQQRNFIATLLLSQGVPMLLAGDEFGHTQRGNNNAYCQDNETSWLDWSLDDAQDALLAFTQRLIALRAAHPVFRRRDFFRGTPLIGADVRDVLWLQPGGAEMTVEAWQHGETRALAVFLAGDGLTDNDARGQPVRDQSFVMLFNASSEAVAFTLPMNLRGPAELLVDTSNEQADWQPHAFDTDAAFSLPARALALVRIGHRHEP
jgi:isoamylase